MSFFAFLNFEPSQKSTNPQQNIRIYEFNHILFVKLCPLPLVWEGKFAFRNYEPSEKRGPPLHYKLHVHVSLYQIFTYYSYTNKM